MIALIKALRFLTILPLPDNSMQTKDSAIVAAYPWAGAVIGLLICSIAFAANLIMSVWSTAVIMVISKIILTGGLHMDGLADYADSLGAGKDIDKKMSVMQDSRLGSYGVLSLLIISALQTIFAAEYLKASAVMVRYVDFYPLISIPVITRGTIPLLMKIFPSTSTEELGSIVRKTIGRATIGFSLISTVLIVFVFGRLGGLIVYLGTVIVMMGCATSMNRHLKGLTGDCYGMAIEIGDTAALFGFMIMKNGIWSSFKNFSFG